MKRYFVILNPVGGNSDLRVTALLLGKYLKDNYTLYTTTGHENLRQVIASAIKKGHKIFVTIGGDGTVSDCAEALIATKIPLVIVPTGTANNLALELGIPRDIARAIRMAITKHSYKHIDAMQIGKRHYFLDVSIGARSLAVRDTKREAKLRFGLFAYMAKGAQWLVAFNPRKFTITADGKSTTYSASEIVIANAGILGIPALRYSKQMKIDDGILNVCIINANSVREYVKVGYRFLRNNKAAQEHVQFITAKKTISITSHSTIPVQADGEIIGKGSVTVRLVPRALRVVVPR